VAKAVPCRNEKETMGDDINNAGNAYIWNGNFVPGGPPVTYVYVSSGHRDSPDQYENTFGRIAIGPGSQNGHADYWWSGQGPASNPDNKHHDLLTYEGRIALPGGSDTPNPVICWKYKAVQGGAQWWLALSENALSTDNSLFPIYFSFDNTQFQRWLTYSGWQRP
jgi:hypothetical protein